MIILRRNKKNVELYPIGPAKGALNSEREPLFYSYFKLKENNGKIISETLKYYQEKY